MKKMLLGIYGASGFGKEVIPVARESLSVDGKIAEFVFIDDNPISSKVNSFPVLTYDEFLSNKNSVKAVVVAIADSVIREKIFKRLKSNKIDLIDIKSSNVVIMDNVDLGKGYILSPFVTLTSSVKIGVGFHANIYSYVAHDCVIGNFVTFAPGVKCNGNVKIEDHAYIGTGAIIKQGRPDKPITIGRGAIVGMGAVVTKDVPPGTTIIGNPAKPLYKSAFPK